MQTTTRNFIGNNNPGLSYISNNNGESWLPVLMVICQYYAIPSLYQTEPSPARQQKLQEALTNPGDIFAETQDVFINVLNGEALPVERIGTYETMAKKIAGGLSPTSTEPTLQAYAEELCTRGDISTMSKNLIRQLVTDGLAAIAHYNANHLQQARMGRNMALDFKH